MEYVPPQTKISHIKKIYRLISGVAECYLFISVSSFRFIVISAAILAIPAAAYSPSQGAAPMAKVLVPHDSSSMGAEYQHSPVQDRLNKISESFESETTAPEPSAPSSGGGGSTEIRVILKSRP